MMQQCLLENLHSSAKPLKHLMSSCVRAAVLLTAIITIIIIILLFKPILLFFAFWITSILNAWQRSIMRLPFYFLSFLYLFTTCFNIYFFLGSTFLIKSTDSVCFRFLTSCNNQNTIMSKGRKGKLLLSLLRKTDTVNAAQHIPICIDKQQDTLDLLWSRQNGC